MFKFFKKDNKEYKKNKEKHYSYDDMSLITPDMLKNFGFERDYYEGYGTLFQKCYYGDGYGDSDFRIQVWYEERNIFCLGSCFQHCMHCEIEEFTYGTLSRFAMIAKMPLYGEVYLKSNHLTEEYLSKYNWLSKMTYKKYVLKYMSNSRAEIKGLCGFFNVTFKDEDGGEVLCVNSGIGKKYFKADFCVNCNVENKSGIDYFDEDTFERIVGFLKEIYKDKI